MQQGGSRERSEGKKITIRQEIQREDKIGKEKGSVAFFRKTIKIIFLSKNWKQRNPREVVEKAGLFRRTNTDPLCFVLCVVASVSGCGREREFWCGVVLRTPTSPQWECMRERERERVGTRVQWRKRLRPVPKCKGGPRNVSVEGKLGPLGLMPAYITFIIYCYNNL